MSLRGDVEALAAFELDYSGRAQPLRELLPADPVLARLAGLPTISLLSLRGRGFTNYHLPTDTPERGGLGERGLLPDARRGHRSRLDRRWTGRRPGSREQLTDPLRVRRYCAQRRWIPT